MRTNSDILRRFGDQVRKLRIKKGLSQEELAAAAKLHRTYIGGVERGEINLSLENIEKIAKGLGVRVAALLSLKFSTRPKPK